jgi:Sulfate permease family
VGATAAASSITASVVASQNAANANEYGEMLAVVVLAVGVLFVLGGLLRLGFIAAFIPRPVMAGFVFGLGLFIMTKQIYKVFGLPKPSGSTVQLLATDISNLDKIDWTTAAVGVGAIVTLLAFERFVPKVPGVLVVLLGGIGLSAALNLGKHGVDIVGKVPGGLPDTAIPSLSSGELAGLVAGAVGVMLVIMSEGLGAADNFAQKHHYRVDTNQELFATGIANLGSSFRWPCQRRRHVGFVRQRHCGRKDRSVASRRVGDGDLDSSFSDPRVHQPSGGSAGSDCDRGGKGPDQGGRVQGVLEGPPRRVLARSHHVRRGRYLGCPAGNDPRCHPRYSHHYVSGFSFIGRRPGPQARYARRLARAVAPQELGDRSGDPRAARQCPTLLRQCRRDAG